MSAPPLFLLYGSVTGNAEHITKDLAKQFGQSALELDTFKRKCVPTWESGDPYCMVIVTSTTGNGDPPDNAGRFLRFIKRCKDPAYFANCHYAVLALGDTNYDKFCATGRMVDKKLAELGGTRLKDVALADEATGLEEVVEPWIEDIVIQVNGFLGGASAENTEETKEESPAASVSPPVDAASSSSTSLGSRLVRSILEKEPDFKLSSLIDATGSSFSHRPSRATCVFLSPDAAAQTDDDVSVGSSDDTYSAAKPFTSTITRARYLTSTETEPARRSAADLDKANQILNEAFPLHGPNAERNGKRVIELDLSIPPTGQDWEYEPGDSVGVLVPNTPESVSYTLNQLQQNQGISPESLVEIDGKRPLTVRAALETMVDLSAPLPKTSKRLFSSWAQLLTSVHSEEAACFQLMARTNNPDGNRICGVLCDEQRWTVVDFLRSFPALARTITLQDIMGAVPLLPPRYYSVASSPLEQTDTKAIKIAFSVVDYMTPSLVLAGTSARDGELGKRRVRGVGTGLLETLASAQIAGIGNGKLSTVRIFPKPTADFRIPKDTSAKLILIGPGTGIAPFMGFLQHRRCMQASPAVPEGEIDVYFGCRHRDHDFLYQSELEELSNQGVIANLHLSFSRDANSEFRYVQHRLREQADRLIPLLMHEGASVYLCGDGNSMAKDVQATFVTLFTDHFAGDAEKGAAFLVDLKAKGRFVMDIWS